MTSTRSTRLTRTAAVVATGLVACAPLLATAPAHAKDGRVTASGSCGGPTWKLQAQPDDGRVQIEFELDSNVVGQTWAVKIADNGTSVFSGSRRTTAPSGSFSVEVRTANRTGNDVITAGATRGAKTCSGAVTLPA